MNIKELTRTAVIALIFFGIGAAAAESNLNTFTLRADKVLTDYIGGNAATSEVNITGLIIQAGQVLGYYNNSATDALLEEKANALELTSHTRNSSNPHNVTSGQVGAAASSHNHSGDNITSAVASATNADMVDGKHYSNISSEINGNILAHAGNISAHHVKTTSVGDLTDHNTTNHNSLGINADTVDNYHAGNAANQTPVLDSNAKVHIAQMPILGGWNVGTYVNNLGTDVFHANDAEKMHNTAIYTKKKQVTLTTTPDTNLKISFQLRSNGGWTGYGKIYRDGVPVGISHGVTGSIYTQQIETIDGWSNGNTLELWIKGNGGAVWVKELRILGTVSSINGISNTDPKL